MRNIILKIGFTNILEHHIIEYYTKKLLQKFQNRKMKNGKYSTSGTKIGEKDKIMTKNMDDQFLETIFHKYQNKSLSWKDADLLLQYNPTDEAIWDRFFEKIADYRWNQQKQKKHVKTYHPGNKFPALSLTGTNCDLDCEHCHSRYLHGMRDISTPTAFKECLQDLVLKNCTGALLSGGCEENGRVPLEKVLPQIKKFKTTHQFYFNSHLGIADSQIIHQLTEAQIDLVSFDLVLNPKVIRDIFHSSHTVDDYIKTYKTLQEENIRLVPHVLIGSYFGRISTEIETLKFITENPTEMMVFIVMIPPKLNGKYDSRFNFILPEDVARLIFIMHYFNPKMELSLGCMRLRSHKFRKMEKWGIQAGLTRIEMPGKKTEDWLQKEHIQIDRFDACCAISETHEQELKKRD